MSRLHRSLAALSGIALLAGCLGTPGVVKPSAASGAAAGSAGRPAAAAAFSTVVGSLRAPAGLVVAPGAPIVSKGGGNVVSNNGGSYVLRALAEVPVADVEIVLADLRGEPVSGIPAVRTDATGAFTFPKVPPDLDLLVLARPLAENQRPLLLQALIRSARGGARADITIASSMVSHAVLTDAAGSTGKVNLEAIGKATAAVGKNLGPETVPDMTDRPAILAAMDRLAKDVAEIRAAIDELRRDLADIKSKLDEIADKLDRSPTPAASPAAPPSAMPAAGSPLPVATTSPAASPSPTTAPSATVSASPTPAASVAPSPAAGIGLTDGVPSGWQWFTPAGNGSYYTEAGSWVVVAKSSLGAPAEIGKNVGIQRTLEGDFDLEIGAETDIPAGMGGSLYTEMVVKNGTGAHAFLGRQLSATRREAMMMAANSSAGNLPGMDTDIPDRYGMRLKRLNDVIRGQIRVDDTGEWLTVGEVVAALPASVEVCINLHYSGSTSATQSVRFRTIKLTQP